MGGKSSKSQLQRNKSLSSIGRSSQRGLFQKSKAKLKAVEKEIELYDSAKQDVLKKEFEDVRKSLSEISETVKVKHKQRYEEILKYYQEVYQKFEERTKAENTETSTTQVSEGENEVSNQNSEEVEIRERPKEETVQPESPKIKFGIQVMPIDPRVSQELLKRKTTPTSEAAKIEFEQIRNNLELSVRRSISHAENKQNAEALIMTEIYNEHFPQNTDEVTANKGNLEKTIITVEKVRVKSAVLQHIDIIRSRIDDLEYQLRYFTGNKGDDHHTELNEKFIRVLIDLDQIEIEEDPVAKQERKILIQRTQELLKILERLVEQIAIVNDSTDQKVIDNIDSIAPVTFTSI